MLSSPRSPLNSAGTSRTLASTQRSLQSYFASFMGYSSRGYIPGLQDIEKRIGKEKVQILVQSTFYTKAEGPESNMSGKTPLFLAVIQNQTDSVRYLIKTLHANPNQKCFEKTPLHAAVNRKNESMIILLLELGANPKIPDINNETPLDIAKKLGLDHLFETYSRESK